MHAVVPAAGTGQRFDARGNPESKPKQYRELAGEPVIVRALEILLAQPQLDCIWVVLAPQDQQGPELLASLLKDHPERLRLCLQGGATRRDSVLAGLRMAHQAGAGWVMVHDAARPMLQGASLEALINSCLSRNHGGILALPVVDTVKRARVDKAYPMVEQTLPRERLWLAQTPQLFPADRLLQALERFDDVTDEACAMERLGDPVALIQGERSNIKLTYADDLQELELRLANHQSADFRIGEGYDVHALVPGRALIIGGVRIDYPMGLLGHSDADVLLHAITDALLGAAGLGDIGEHFPDHDGKLRGADSSGLLSQVAGLIRDRGWSIVNLDCTVLAQRPKLAPYRQSIIDSIASTLQVPAKQINVKAKTQELLGFEGRGEGISARAVVLIVASSGPDPARR
ncbi:MAG: 2-C-methyl-D-erythritol 2,4-cyclodiphosphate synthase [Betaproteobacteria bacterium]|nr:2-C-methyl-D-erythritol 2,4-cyclodiphosphate synthase [Betaproteobacteria bacterium]NCV40161.1 2-C-methyl-D-erythritol 2,4-cyclodiphosphate synthase [Betaproteobacteria bacterium]NCW31969.1 2-C-methyl-D-erythritol 2,4-cyclodiphosphate synthase [Betaproteobacteria bacterium]NCZ45961.1 2-C-methyl-D-erythritol 2,4-cyclodiphosphate synthase [Betaproteobacteria bacterium]NCZ97907.1 2-C-methyl-D-erythritol 2,4-cyclodiphosphate synthase [Betaproteobacteria bacterium]